MAASTRLALLTVLLWAAAATAQRLPDEDITLIFDVSRSYGDLTAMDRLFREVQTWLMTRNRRVDVILSGAPRSYEVFPNVVVRSFASDMSAAAARLRTYDVGNAGLLENLMAIGDSLSSNIIFFSSFTWENWYAQDAFNGISRVINNGRGSRFAYVVGFASQPTWYIDFADEFRRTYGEAPGTWWTGGVGRFSASGMQSRLNPGPGGPATTQRPDLDIPVEFFTGCITKADLLFIVDRSGSIRRAANGRNDFWELQISFIQSFIKFEVSMPSFRVGMILFDSNAHEFITMGQFTDKDQLLGQINSNLMGNPQGVTVTGEALDLADRMLFGGIGGTGSNGGEGRPKIIIIITDGKPTDRDRFDYPEEAAQLHYKGVTVVSVGVGEDADEETLREIASREDFVVNLDNFEELSRNVENVKQIALCRSVTCSYTETLDLTFVVDTSDAVSDSDWVDIEGYLEDTFKTMKVEGRDNVRIAVVTYGDSVNIEFDLDDYIDQMLPRRDMVEKVRAIRRIRGRARLAEALDRVRTTIYTRSNGDRPGFDNRNVVIVLSLGASADPAASARAAQQLKDDTDAAVIAGIAIGGASRSEMDSIASAEPGMGSDGIRLSYNYEARQLRSEIYTVLTDVCAILGYARVTREGKGPTGDTGPDGSRGRPGISGPPGVDGPPGRQGPDGFPGPSGAPGSAGDRGDSGRPGAPGPDGPPGRAGSPGFQGLPGGDGRNGPPGVPGPDGFPGGPGLTGDRGEPGSGGDGLKGAKGTKGQPGDIGRDGRFGQDGLAGRKGIKGDSGVEGPPGSKGDQGFQGQAGPDGPTGPVGRTGPPGIGNAGEPGRQGAKGAQGDKGRNGVRGPDGQTGLQGIRGQSGQPGSDGFDGRRGESGARGDPGRRGFDGAPGEPGRGFPGRGGAPGDRGSPGFPGRDGSDGPDGRLGAPGEPGRQGERGDDGFSGPEGVDGPKGFDGAPGAPGLRGPSGFGGPGRKGEKGDVGRRGSDGLSGEQGDPGAPGFRGFDGPMGRRGNSGGKGEGGRDGGDGRPGLTGEKGEPGRSGAGSKGVKGQEGADGPKGFEGRDGRDGRRGAEGLTGVRGPAGRPGTDGSKGSDGAPGGKGEKGETGATGDRGLDGGTSGGSKGLPGPRGRDGPPGFSGNTGPKGEQGPMGDKGVRGSNGLDGLDGEIGEKGDPGRPGGPGFRGRDGATGFTGATGLRGGDGIPGEIGDTGIVGPRGPDGFDGDTGATGSRGDPGRGRKGERGPVGPSGPVGPTGRSGGVIVDECDNDNGGCQQLCVSTFFSHYCACHPGYKLTQTEPPSCPDDARPGFRGSGIDVVRGSNNGGGSGGGNTNSGVFPRTDLVLVVDGSGGTSDPGVWSLIRRFLAGLVRALLAREDTRVAFVFFEQDRAEIAFTSREAVNGFLTPELAARAIEGLRPYNGRGASIGRGLILAADLLQESRNAAKLVFVLTTGNDRPYDSSVDRAVAVLKQQGTRRVLLGVGGAPDRPAYEDQEITTSRELIIEVPEFSRLDGQLFEVAAQLRAVVSGGSGGGNGESPGHQCSNKVDLAIILDASGSIGHQSATRMWMITLDFIKRLVMSIGVNYNGARIGIVVFSVEATTTLMFDQSLTAEGVVKAVNSQQMIGGKTNISAGLYEALRLFRGPSDRFEAANMALLISDGLANLDVPRTYDAAAELKRYATVHTVAVTQSNDREMLSRISSDGEVYLRDDYDRSEQFIDKFMEIACDVDGYFPSADIALVIDDTELSGNEWRDFLAAVQNFVRGLNLQAQSNARLGTVLFSGGGTVEDGLDSNWDSVVDNLGRLRDRRDENVDLGMVLRELRDEFFTAERGDRTEVPNIAVVFTFNDYRSDSFVAEAQILRESGIGVLAVGIDRGVSTDFLRRLAFNGETALSLDGVGDMDRSLDRLARAARIAVGLVYVPHWRPAMLSNQLCYDTCCHGVQCFCWATKQSLNSSACMNINECSMNNGGCSHECMDTEGSYRCLCPEGLQLGDDDHCCVDVDECENDPCGSMECVNTFGGYTCLQDRNRVAGSSPVIGMEAAVLQSATTNTLMGATVGTALGTVALIAAVGIVVRTLGARKTAKKRKGPKIPAGMVNSAFQGDQGATMRASNNAFDDVSLRSSEGDTDSLSSANLDTIM